MARPLWVMKQFRKNFFEIYYIFWKINIKDICQVDFFSFLSGCSKQVKLNKIYYYYWENQFYIGIFFSEAKNLEKLLSESVHQTHIQSCKKSYLIPVPMSGGGQSLKKNEPFYISSKDILYKVKDLFYPYRRVGLSMKSLFNV